MTVHADILSEAGEANASSSILNIQDTQWGFIVHESAKAPGQEILAQTGLKFLAFTALLAAGAQWLLPGSLFTGDVLLMKLGLTSALVASAVWFLRGTARSGVPELQVDAVRREIRIATRSQTGASRIRSRIAMRDIEECFVRPGRAAEETELCFRVLGHDDPVRIAAGGVGDLAPVLERLTRDLRTPRERVHLKLAG